MEVVNRFPDRQMHGGSPPAELSLAERRGTQTEWEIMVQRVQPRSMEVSKKITAKLFCSDNNFDIYILHITHMSH